MHSKELKKIRLQLGYTVRDFAELLGFGDKFTTYYCYETNKRECPDKVVQDARDALKRDNNFFRKHLPASIDKHQKTPVPNEAIKGAW